MSVIDITEEIVSEIDLNVEYTSKGLSVSIFIDECEIHDVVDYDIMAYQIVQDEDKYPPELIRCIRKGLATMINILEEAEDDGRE